jgi:DNA invertase Pin-like site-specific DNA recombinase
MIVMTALKPLCYSYVRFSTPDQIKGDSKRRQIDKARAWAFKEGYEFDESLTIRDEGKSGWKGDHLKTGNLGKFLKRINSEDDIPRGSVLYVEAVDRLTRMEFTDAMNLILGLLEKVKVMIPQLLPHPIDKKFLNENTGFVHQFIGLCAGANAESKRKSENLKASWDTKRKMAKEGCLYTETTPEWISVEPFVNRKLRKDEKVMKRFTRDATKSEKVIVGVIPERGKILKSIFTKYNRGESMHSIASWLNSESVETWRGGKSWHRSYIKKLLSNPSVYGTLQQCKMEKVEDGELGLKLNRKLQNEVKDYYPKAITPNLFKKVQAKLPQKGKSGGARATQNALSNLCECPKCGSTMTRVNKGEKSGAIPKLVCTNRHKLGSCDHGRFNQHEVELSMRRFFDRWDYEQGLVALINAKPKEREQLVKKVKEINETLVKANKLPYSAERNNFMLKLLNDKRKLELKTDYNIDISAKQFNESISKFKSASTPSEQNANLRQIINKIIIHKVDDLEVSFIGCEKKFRIRKLHLPNPARKKLLLSRRKHSPLK